MKMSSISPAGVVLWLASASGSILIGCSNAPSKNVTPPAKDGTGSSASRECKRPEYPPESLRLGEQGVVRLRFHYDPDGNPIRAEVLRSSGSRRLDQVTIDALMRCQVKPGLEDGRPVESYIDLDYTWKIE